ncbi:MAG: dihydrolipoyl dehydrogenase [Pirellulales bacterium]
MAADLGLDVTILDERASLGGTCLIEGCIPSKMLLHVTAAMHDAESVADWGVRYARPDVDMAQMRGHKADVIANLAAGLAQLAKSRGVRVVAARGRFTASDALALSPCGDAALDDDVLSFDHCVVATGSVPVRLPNLPYDSPRLLDSTAALRLQDVPASLLVVGGGYIGLELGSVYAALGSHVSLVEYTDGLLPGVDRDLVRPLLSRTKQTFASLSFGAKVTAAVDHGNDIEVTVASGDETFVETYDQVLVSVGRRPRTDDLGLETTQVQLDEHGFIRVDAQRRTDDRRIFAVGDVTGQPMLAHKASAEGRVAAEAIAGSDAEFAPRAIPCVVFTDPQIAWTGLTEAEAKTAGIKVSVTRFPWAASGRAQAVGRTDGVTKMIVDAESDRLLGVGITGPAAGEMIAEAVLAIEMGATSADVGRAIHPHPTFSETIAAAAHMQHGTATEIYRPKRQR